MFEGIISFFKKFGKSDMQDSKSKDTAKERLHLVLMQDRANVSADFLEMMKQEIIDVIKKYINVDESEIDVKLTNKTNDDGTAGAPALYANIPIVSIKNENKKTVKELIDKENNEKEKEEKTSKKSVTKKEVSAKENKIKEESKNIEEKQDSKEDNESENNKDKLDELEKNKKETSKKSAKSEKDEKTEENENKKKISSKKTVAKKVAKKTTTKKNA